MTPITLGILHTNDTHSYLDQFAQRAHLVASLRARYAHSLLLGAGDLFVGGPYFQLFGGQAEIALLNQLGYDAVTFGNHEFDLGPRFLATYLDQARFPFISSNLDFRPEPVLAGYADRIRPFALYRLGPGVSLAVLAATTLETLGNSSPGDLIDFQDPQMALERAIGQARRAGASHFVLLSHLGYEADLALAEVLPDFAAIVGGHTHTETAQPTQVGQTLVVQAGDYGRLLGEMGLTLYPGGGHQLAHYQLHDLVHYQQVAPEMAADLGGWQAQVAARASQVVGQTAVYLDGSRDHLTHDHTNLSVLVCQAYAAVAHQRGWAPDFSLINGRGVRASLDVGPVTYQEALAVLSFGCRLWVFEVSGADLIQALAQGHYPRVVAADGQTYTEHRLPDLDPTHTYQLVTNDFLARGRDGYDGLSKHRLVDDGLGLDLTALIAQLAPAHAVV